MSVLLESQNLLFAHVPKTGGGSISRALRKRPDALVFPVQGMATAAPCMVQLRKQLPQPIHSYQTVAVVRNPWDWAVSGFLHLTRNMPAYETPPTFRDFTLGAWREATINPYPTKFANAEACVAYHTQITQHEHLFPAGLEVRLWRICKFETLARDVLESLRVEDLPHAHQSERRHYSHYYDAETRCLIGQRNAPLIARFGYAFEAVDAR